MIIQTPSCQKAASVKVTPICSRECPKRRVTGTHKAECQQQPSFIRPTLCLSAHLSTTDSYRMNSRKLPASTHHCKNINFGVKPSVSNVFSLQDARPSLVSCRRKESNSSLPHALCTVLCAEPHKGLCQSSRSYQSHALLSTGATNQPEDQ